jgi:protein gp37
MNRTKIDWPFENLYTWNPIFGCLHGCKYCYARKMAIRFKGSFKPKFDEHIFNDKSIRTPRTRSIFIGSMADVFGDWVAFHDIQRVLEKIRLNPQHKYIFLTKNPARYLEFDFRGIDCWLGVTLTHGPTWRAGEIMHVLKNIGYKTFLSAEPLLGSFQGSNLIKEFDLVIAGALTGQRNAAPLQEWIDSIVHPRVYYKKSIRSLGLKTGGRVAIETLPNPLLSPAAGNIKNTGKT